MSRLSIRNVSKSYFSRKKSLLALSSANLDIGEGEFICLVGPSGCGKTTLLNMIAGLIKSDTGSISYDGEIISGPGPDRTVVFQDFALFPWLNVLHNVEFGLRFTGIPRAKRFQIALENLKSVGLDNFTHARIHELSGGMKQRVAIARALALRPRVLLMDEPFAALDAMTRDQLYADLQAICAGHGITVVFVTHNVREAVCLGDRVILFLSHPGRICGEFCIRLPRPRQINDPGVARLSSNITRALKSISRTAEEKQDAQTSCTLP